MSLVITVLISSPGIPPSSHQGNLPVHLDSQYFYIHSMRTRLCEFIQKSYGWLYYLWIYPTLEEYVLVPR